MVKQLLNRISTVAAEEGLLAVLTKMLATGRHTIRGSQTRDKFDITFRTDTAAEVPLWRLNIPSDNARHGCQYQTTDPEVFSAAMRTIPHELREGTFIDLGCGKGRTLILAAREGFRRVLGVEFSPELAAVARKNICQLAVSAEVLELDVVNLSFPDDDLVVYMYNPFDKSVMHTVANNLIEWHRRSGKIAFVVYVNPTCHSIFDACPDFQSLVTVDTLRVSSLGT